MTRKPSFNLKKYANQLGVIPLAEQTEIFRRAIEEMNRRHVDLVSRMKTDFDSLVQEIESEAYRIYVEEEKRFAGDVIKTYMGKNKTDEKTIVEFLVDNERFLAGMYLSLIQGRKNRAGKTLERILNLLFENIGYPFTHQPEDIDGRPDYIMPSVEYYKTTPLNCIVFTSKRKLRERWRQIVTEGMRGIGFYLGTIDDELSEAELRHMADHRIFVVCPKEIKNQHYSTISNVLSYEQFFEEHLEPKAKIWRREGLMT